MRETTLSSAELRFLVLLLGFLALAMSGAILHTRHEWKALKHKLFKPHDGLVKSSRPGRIAERLSSARWDSAFRETLEKARRDLASTGETAAAAFEAMAAAEDMLGKTVGSVALRAMARGELQSAVVRIDKAIVYVLVFPGRHDDRRVFRRFEPLSEGLPAHAAAVRRAAGGGGSAPPLVALVYFLGLDARDGSLLAAYEGDDGRRYAAELSPTSHGPPGATCEPGLTYQFALT